MSADNITLDGISFEGDDNDSYPVTHNIDVNNITMKNLLVKHYKNYFFRNSEKQITNLVVEGCEFEDFYDVNSSFVFFLTNVVSARFNNNVFDNINRHGINIEPSPNATNLVFENNTFKNCANCAIQIKNRNSGIIDINHNTVDKCETAFHIYVWKSDGDFAAKVDIKSNNISNVRYATSVGCASDYNDKTYTATPQKFEDGAYVTVSDNIISLDYYKLSNGNLVYASLLSDYYGYDGVVTFTNNDISGGRTGVYNTWENIITQPYIFYTCGNDCTQINIDGKVYTMSNTTHCLTEI